MKTNIEAIAIKNLQDILRERGYTAETLFSKFDTDGNGALSKIEFEAALRSITGQVAPQAILNAVFGALDRDSSGSLELAELLSIVDSGVTHSFSSGQSIVVEDHPQDRFNGTYSQQEGTMNGKPFFKNQSGCLLYAFSSGSSASSWNLDDRDQNGSNDWYRGGWTRAPPDGSLPLGVRRWVGVGKLSLSPTDPGANANTGSVENEDLDSIDAEFPEYDQQLSDLLSEFDSALNYFEGKVTNGELSADQAMEMANTAFERKSSELPPVLRYSAQKVWEKKTSRLEDFLRSNAPSPSSIAAGAAAMGTVGAIATSAAQNVPAPLPPPSLPAAPEPEPPAAPEPELPSGNYSDQSEIESAMSAFQDARTISERNSVKDSLSGASSSVQFRVNAVERTFGIGLSDAVRGGNTIIADVEGVGEVEIRMPSSADVSHIKSGYEGELSCTIVDWNAVRRRLIMESI
ncbi:MAG: EF-hand domain-containing protein [Candidatus Thermoplasmatota archaeon]|nr:EF-hand domain-containing protein [Candidatus Thermoplasmatota archaeon]